MCISIPVKAEMIDSFLLAPANCGKKSKTYPI